MTENIGVSLEDLLREIPEGNIYQRMLRNISRRYPKILSVDNEHVGMILAGELPKGRIHQDLVGGMGIEKPHNSLRDDGKTKNS